MSLGKRFASGRLALLVMLGLLGCMAFADVGSAASPKVPAGNACVASDGKINGRGSTFQKLLILNIADAYRDDICGATGTGSNENGEAGNTMIAYNYPEAESHSATGSGAGEKAADCRTDAFSGTDVPYKRKQLEEMDSEPGVGGELGGAACKIAFSPPFQPNLPAEWPDKEVGHEDTTAELMSFPIGGSAVAVPVHLANEGCNGKAPTSLNFTAKEVSRLLGGDAKEWGDAELVGTDPSLKECAGLKITRVVRFDNSGTTNIMKLFLARVDNARTGAVCAPGKNWEFYNTSPNTIWPGKQEPGKEGECAEITTGGSSGNPTLLKKLSEIDGAVGYADLADVVASKPAKEAGVFMAPVTPKEGGGFQSPSSGEAANCDYKKLSLPGTTASDAVGLNPEENWASDNPGGNRGNATDIGTKYPICGLTWDLVYTHLDQVGGVEGLNAITRLTADQRRTEYSFYTFLLSSTGQEVMKKINYAPLPTAWLSKLKEGFQDNY